MRIIYIVVYEDCITVQEGDKLVQIVDDLAMAIRLASATQILNFYSTGLFWGIELVNLTED